jgi:hypothetical protein
MENSENKIIIIIIIIINKQHYMCTYACTHGASTLQKILVYFQLTDLLVISNLIYLLSFYIRYIFEDETVKFKSVIVSYSYSNYKWLKLTYIL